MGSALNVEGIQPGPPPLAAPLMPRAWPVPRLLGGRSECPHTPDSALLPCPTPICTGRLPHTPKPLPPHQLPHPAGPTSQGPPGPASCLPLKGALLA